MRVDMKTIFKKCPTCGGDITFNDVFCWQLIETAPRDGTKILTLNDDDEMAVSFYVEDWCEVSVFVRHAKDGDVYKKVMEDSGYWYVDNCLSQPTHWMPLPSTVR